MKQVISQAEEKAFTDWYNNEYLPQQQQLQQQQLQQLIYDYINQPLQPFEYPQFNYTPPPVLSWEEAQARAQSRLNPLYEEQLEKTLEAVDRDTMKRGFFGQLPAAALRRSTAADIERAKMAAIAELANQLVGQSEASARAAEKMALEKWKALADAAYSQWQTNQAC